MSEARYTLSLGKTDQVWRNKTTRTLYGFEVGNLMDMRQAKYAKTHNWQQGFGILYVDGKNVYPQPVPIEKKSFMVEGTVYSW